MNAKRKTFALGLLLVTACAALMPPARPSAAGQVQYLRPASGMFLVAASTMRDPRFSQSVILLVDYSADGSLGFIVNRKSDVALSEALPELDQRATVGQFVYFGGPVQPTRAAYLYWKTRQTTGQKVLNDVYWGNSYDEMRDLLNDDSVKALRFFFGYAGWGPSQLDFEISLGDWKLAPASVDQIFSDDTEHLWRRLNAAEPGIMAQSPGGPRRVAISGRPQAPL